MAQSVACWEADREGKQRCEVGLALGNRGDQDQAKQDRSVMRSVSEIALRSVEIETT